MNITRVLSLTASLVLIWALWGLYLFLSKDWAIGEIGDFYGGGIGALTLLIVVYTVWEQYQHSRKLEQDLFEASLFRTFEALKPEAENLSVRIVSKARKSKLISMSQKEFDLMLSKFRESGDRTVFLRAIKDNKKIFKKNITDEEFLKSVGRFTNILNLIEKGLEKIKSTSDDHSDDDFVQAIKSTELFETYIVLKDFNNY